MFSMPKSTKSIDEINVDLLNDAIFKAIFRSEELRDIIANFLSILTKIPKRDIMKASFQGGELPKSHQNEKGRICDVIIKIDENRLIIVEMNKQESPYLIERNSGYLMAIMTQKQPIKSSKLPCSYLISIDNFNGFEETDGILEFAIYNKHGIKEHGKYTSIHLIIENILNDDYNGNKEIKKMMTLLKMTKIKDMEEKFKGDEEYMRIIEKIKSLVCKPELIGYYNLKEVHESELEWTRQESLKDGIAEGKAEGITEGIMSQQRAIVKNMLAKKYSKKEISDILNITSEEFESLKKTL